MSPTNVDCYWCQRYGQQCPQAIDTTIVDDFDERWHKDNCNVYCVVVEVDEGTLNSSSELKSWASLDAFPYSIEETSSNTRDLFLKSNEAPSHMTFQELSSNKEFVGMPCYTQGISSTLTWLWELKFHQEQQICPFHWTSFGGQNFDFGWRIVKKFLISS